jgi:hypothetical protein
MVHNRSRPAVIQPFLFFFSIISLEDDINLFHKTTNKKKVPAGTPSILAAVQWARVYKARTEFVHKR